MSVLGLKRRANRLFAAVLVAAALAPVVAAPPSVLPLVLTDPDSGSQRRVDADGRAVHLFFFATWCQRCLNELPRLAEIEERYGSAGYRLVVVAVSARQSAERLREFVRERRPPGTLLLDSNGSAEKALGIDRIPAHVLLDREGRVVARASALDDRFVSEVESLVARGGSTGESRP